MELETPIRKFIEVSLSIDDLEKERTGINPFLSRETFDYGVEDPHWDWKVISKKLDELDNEVDTLEESRRLYLHTTLKAYRMMTRYGLGEKIPYADRVKTFLDLDEIVIPESEIEANKNAVCEKLAEAGYPDDYGRGIAEWKKATRLSAEELDPFGQSVLAEGRKRVMELGLDIPEEQHTELHFPHNYPYRGYSSYDGNYQGNIWLNGDTPWGRPELKHTILHEAYPGHQILSVVREKMFRDGTINPEATMVFYNTGISPIHEGQCELAERLIGMKTSIDDDIAELNTDYTNGMETNLAIAGNEGRLDADQVAKILREQTCMDPVLSKVRFGFFTNPLWSTCFPHYYHGRKYIRQTYLKLEKLGLRNAYIQMVFKEPHTVKTMEKAVGELIAKTAQTKAD